MKGLIELVRDAGGFRVLQVESSPEGDGNVIGKFTGTLSGRSLSIEVHDFGAWVNPRARYGVVIVTDFPYPIVAVGATLEATLGRVDWDGLEPSISDPGHLEAAAPRS